MLTILITVLFSGSVMTVYAEESGAKIRMERTEAAQEETEVGTEVQLATATDGWSTTITGKPDTEPKTLDDIYEVLFWILCAVCIFLAGHVLLWIVEMLLY